MNVGKSNFKGVMDDVFDRIEFGVNLDLDELMLGQ
jgi:hypothetical protein